MSVVVFIMWTLTVESPLGRCREGCGLGEISFSAIVSVSVLQLSIV